MEKFFVMPEIPFMLSTSKQGKEYLVNHYWDNFNFSDTSYCGKANLMEQIFVEYINLFPYATQTVVEQSIFGMLDKASMGGQGLFEHFTELYQKYLYDSNSPFRQEEYYVIVLKAIIANNNIEEILKESPRYRLAMVLKNRNGDIATDFTFVSPNGVKNKLSQIKSDHIILFFNNPDCHDCARVKEILSGMYFPGVKVVAIYPDEDLDKWQNTKYPTNWVNGSNVSIRADNLYDLKAIPTLYLLDKDKRVILKDAPVEHILQYIEANVSEK